MKKERKNFKMKKERTVTKDDSFDSYGMLKQEEFL